MFNTYHDDKDTLLRGLTSLEGIGVVIASGLIFATWRDTYVPFDKYTTGYAVQRNLISGPDVSRNYSKYSAAVLNYINESGHFSNIANFVYQARNLCRYPVTPEQVFSGPTSDDERPD